MSNFFGSIPEPEIRYIEITYSWLPIWAYNYEEIEYIKKTCVKYDHNTYTMLEKYPEETHFYNRHQH